MPRKSHSPTHRRLALRIAVAALTIPLPAVTLVLVAPDAAAATMCRGRVASIVGTEGPDVVNGTAGSDIVVTLGGNDTVYGFGGDDVICLGAGDDIAYGYSGNNEFVPGTGNDQVYGNNDTLNDLVAFEDITGPVGVNLLENRTSAAAGNDLLLRDRDRHRQPPQRPDHRQRPREPDLGGPRRRRDPWSRRKRPPQGR